MRLSLERRFWNHTCCCYQKIYELISTKTVQKRRRRRVLQVGFFSSRKTEIESSVHWNAGTNLKPSSYFLLDVVLDGVRRRKKSKHEPTTTKERKNKITHDWMDCSPICNFLSLLFYCFHSRVIFVFEFVEVKRKEKRWEERRWEQEATTTTKTTRGASKFAVVVRVCACEKKERERVSK